MAGWSGVYSERELKRRKRRTEFVYELRDVPDGNLEMNPVACSTNVVEHAMSSGEEIPQQQIYEQLYYDNPNGCHIGGQSSEPYDPSADILG